MTTLNKQYINRTEIIGIRLSQFDVLAIFEQYIQIQRPLRVFQKCSGIGAEAEIDTAPGSADFISSAFTMLFASGHAAASPTLMAAQPPPSAAQLAPHLATLCKGHAHWCRR